MIAASRNCGPHGHIEGLRPAGPLYFQGWPKRCDFGSERDNLGFFDLISSLTRSKNLNCVVTRVIKMIKVIMIIKVIKNGYI